MNIAASASITSLKYLICWFSNLVASSVAENGLSISAIKALEASRDKWQVARSHDFSSLLLVTVMVAVGVVMEGPELVYEVANAVKRWKLRPTPEHPPNWITAVGLSGWLIVSLGVAGEFVVDRWVNNDDDHIQSIDTLLLQDAEASSAKAKLDSETAIANAGDARIIASSASTESSLAKTAAGTALKEANSFAIELKSVKKTAAAAISRLTSAEEREAKDERELKDLRTPRSFTDAQGAIVELQKYKGTEYALNVFPNEEAIGLTKQLIYVLDGAGWIRKHDSFTSNLTWIGIFGTNDPRDTLPSCVDTGLGVHIREGIGPPTSLEVFMTKGDASKALILSLRSRVSPPSIFNVFPAVALDPGANESPIVICVGQKP